MLDKYSSLTESGVEWLLPVTRKAAGGGRRGQWGTPSVVRGARCAEVAEGGFQSGWRHERLPLVWQAAVIHIEVCVVSGVEVECRDGHCEKREADRHPGQTVGVAESLEGEGLVEVIVHNRGPHNQNNTWVNTNPHTSNFSIKDYSRLLWRIVAQRINTAK